MKKYAVHKNWADGVFVKEWNFFVEQGGLKEPWGKGWKPIMASSIEAARNKGKKSLKPHKAKMGPVYRGFVK